MRESPYVEIAKSLIGEGIELKIYDSLVYGKNLVGSNKKQIEKAFRNLNKLLVSSLNDLCSVDLVIINHPIVDSNKIKEWISNGIKVIDLVGVGGDIKSSINGYEGIYW